VLLIGSGNVVHNLRQISWGPNARGFDWAIRFNDWLKEKLVSKDFGPLIHDYLKSPEGQLAVPSPDHYFPFITMLGAAGDDDVKILYDEIQNGSISMLSVQFG
jgi:4,5-DOPA dioxygenase extradiol